MAIHLGPFCFYKKTAITYELVVVSRLWNQLRFDLLNTGTWDAVAFGLSSWSLNNPLTIPSRSFTFNAHIGGTYQDFTPSFVRRLTDVGVAGTVGLTVRYTYYGGFFLLLDSDDSGFPPEIAIGDIAYYSEFP